MRRFQTAAAALLLAVFSQVFLPLPAFTLPGPDDVDRAVREILREDGELPENDRKPLFEDTDIDLSWMDGFFQHGRGPTLILVILVFSLLFITLFIVSSRNIRMNYRGKAVREPRDTQTPRRLKTADAVRKLRETAAEFAERGMFREAVIHIHRAAVLQLKDNLLIIINGHSTNNDILVQLSGNPLRAPFARIARQAEKAAFSLHAIAAEDFSLVLEELDREFLGQEAAHETA